MAIILHQIVLFQSVRMRLYDEEDYGLWGFVFFGVVGLLMIVGLVLIGPIRKWANKPPEPIDEQVACLACGSTENRWETAPGRYACMCGYEGTL